MHADTEAEGPHFPGRSCLPYAWEINRMVEGRSSGEHRPEERCTTLLDYGCGAGLQYAEENIQRYWQIMPSLYDPAIPKFAKKPVGKFDGVICTDVMEHIPEGEIDDSLREIYGYATKAVFFTICCREANRLLPNGMNCHVTIRPENWWRNRLRRIVRMQPKPRPKLIIRFTA